MTNPVLLCALLLAAKLMAEASVDFHNFEGEKSLSGRRVSESHFSFRRSFSRSLIATTRRDVSGRCEHSAYTREINDSGWWTIYIAKKSCILYEQLLFFLLISAFVCREDSEKVASYYMKILKSNKFRIIENN